MEDHIDYILAESNHHFELMEEIFTPASSTDSALCKTRKRIFIQRGDLDIHLRHRADVHFPTEMTMNPEDIVEEVRGSFSAMEGIHDMFGGELWETSFRDPDKLCYKDGKELQKLLSDYMGGWY